MERSRSDFQDYGHDQRPAAGALLDVLLQVVADLLANYSADTPVALIHKATWRQEKIHVGSLGKLLDEIAPGDWELSTMMIVGDVLKREKASESCLYSAEYSHRFRKGNQKVST